MVRFATIGTNWITDKFIESASLVENFSLEAVYSRTDKRAKEFAQKYGVKNTFTDLEKMAKSNMIDAVYIASPNSFHAAQSILFLENNKHVLCEKPIASNVKELKQMINAAQENEVLLMEAMKSTLLPNFQAIRDNLDKIGRIRRIVSNYCQYSSRYDPYKQGKNPNTFNPKFSNGSLMDLGVYCIYPILFFFGAPNSVNANGVALDSGVDGEGIVNLKYDDKDAVVIHSKITDSALSSEIQGEEGNIVIDEISTLEEVKIVYRNGETEDISCSQAKPIMYYEIKEFIANIESNKLESSINSYKLALEVMKVLERARKQIGVIYPADE